MPGRHLGERHSGMRWRTCASCSTRPVASWAKLDNFGLPHSHNRRAVTRAGFKRWFDEIDQKIDWTRMEDRLTGKPFRAEGGDAPSLEIRQSVLREIYDNIAYGKESREAVYGRPKGWRRTGAGLNSASCTSRMPMDGWTTTRSSGPAMRSPRS